MPAGAGHCHAAAVARHRSRARRCRSRHATTSRRGTRGWRGSLGIGRHLARRSVHGAKLSACPVDLLSMGVKSRRWGAECAAFSSTRTGRSSISRRPGGRSTGPSRSSSRPAMRARPRPCSIAGGLDRQTGRMRGRIGARCGNDQRYRPAVVSRPFRRGFGGDGGADRRCLPRPWQSALGPGRRRLPGPRIPRRRWAWRWAWRRTTRPRRRGRRSPRSASTAIFRIVFGYDSVDAAEAGARHRHRLCRSGRPVAARNRRWSATTASISKWRGRPVRARRSACSPATAGATTSRRSPT